MAKHDGAPPPFSLRLTFEERARLEHDAAGMPLGAYMRQRLLDGAPVPKRRGRSSVEDRHALLQVLGLLGQSRLANNMNQIAKAANLGTLPVSDETEAMLQEAVLDIAAMRAALLRAVGMDRSDP